MNFDFVSELFRKSHESLLNDLWRDGDRKKYDDQLRRTKDQGYKVYRNSEGKHKVVKRRDDE